MDKPKLDGALGVAEDTDNHDAQKTFVKMAWAIKKSKN